MKKYITKDERLQIIGLMALAREAGKKLNEAADVMNRIIKADDDYSMLNDIVWDETSVDKALKDMGIVVK